jgi:hypothetical protein
MARQQASCPGEKRQNGGAIAAAGFETETNLRRRSKESFTSPLCSLEATWWRCCKKAVVTFKKLA